MKTVIQNIEQIRKDKGFTQDEIAKKLGITASVYSKIERAEVGITLERLFELAKIFQIVPEDILTYHKTKTGNALYVPIERQRDFLAGRFNNSSDFGVYNLPFIEGKNFIVRCIRDTMHPLIQPGDHLIIEELKNYSKIIYGRVYIVVTEDEPLLRRIHSGKAPGRYILVADNEIYEPIEVSKKGILCLWSVKDYALTTLSPRTNSPDGATKSKKRR